MKDSSFTVKQQLWYDTIKNYLSFTLKFKMGKMENIQVKQKCVELQKSKNSYLPLIGKLPHIYS